MKEVTEMTISELYEFKACPLRHKLTNITKENSQITSNDGLREAIKSTLSYFYYQLQDGYLVSMSELKEKFGSIWYGNLDLYDIKMEGNREKRNRELKAIGMLQSFHRQQKFNPDKVVAVNLDFRVPFGDNFYVKGSIPVIRESPRGMEIVNFKTGNHKYNEFWQRTDMELTLQALGFESLFKKPAESIAVYNMAAGNIIYPERKRKDYKRLYKTVDMVKKSIENDWYYPRESYHCDKCPVQKICMEWN